MSATSAATTESVRTSVRSGAVAAARPRTLRVALAGCGVVGGELARALFRDRATIAARRGLDVEIVRVLVRDPLLPRPTGLDRALLTTSADELIAARADVVVEAIGGLTPALTIARETLGRGARFVTANKALVAAHGGELARIARRSGGTLQFDAAVGGGVPVLRILESALGGARPEAVRGILNGTSNFVLTLLERGATLDEALAEARRRGLAEADPSRDLDGRDSAEKIALVAWTAFGVPPEQVRVRRRGILPDPMRLVRHAGRVGGRVRLVAECRLADDGSVIASVEPTVVDHGSAFARTVLEQNHVEIVTGWTAPLTASGPGAGGSPTATALLSDLLAPLPSRRRRIGIARSRRIAEGAAPRHDDDRLLSWTIGAGCDPVALARVLRDHALALVLCSGDAHESHAITEPARWSEIAVALAALESERWSPIAARILIDGASA